MTGTPLGRLPAEAMDKAMRLRRAAPLMPNGSIARLAAWAYFMPWPPKPERPEVRCLRLGLQAWLDVQYPIPAREARHG